MKIKERRILFATLSFHTFIQKDLTFLRRYYPVLVRHYRNPWDAIKILEGVARSRISFSWFADIHTFFTVLFSKIFRRPSVVIVAGYDAAKVPEISYGLALSPVLFHLVRFVMKEADRVLTVDESLKKDIIKNYRVKGNNISTLPFGFDHGVWNCTGKKEDVVLTVAGISHEVVKRKGLETFVQAAALMPRVSFILAGPHLDDAAALLKKKAPSNVHIPGPVPHEELPRLYSRAKVYCQLSRYEGLPNALCEAMLCECVPVGTRYCGIPTAIGDTGFYVPYGDVQATAEAVGKALKSQKGPEARERIIKNFPHERREKELLSLLEGFLKQK
ncbi:MAG: glycosyltransferase family 4 protein [Candidatus Aminicenantes bacterium]|nr:glycosyltransferase family 4 protein [Candidatus Aminicenantes bacterium]